MDTSSTETKEQTLKKEMSQQLFDYSLSSTIIPQTAATRSSSSLLPRQPLPVRESTSLSHIIPINPNVYQQRQQFDIIMHIDFYTSPTLPPAPDDENQIHSTTMDMETDMDVQMANQTDEDVDEEHDDDDKTVTEYGSDESNCDSDYQTPPTSDNDDSEESHI